MSAATWHELAFHGTIEPMQSHPSPQAPELPWWRQGDLHAKTLADWLEAEANNRLATSLDMLVAMQQDLGAEIHYHQSDELMRYVYEMTGCLDAIAQQQPEPGQIQVSQAALVAARALGYLPMPEDVALPT